MKITTTDDEIDGFLQPVNRLAQQGLQKLDQEQTPRSPALFQPLPVETMPPGPPKETWSYENHNNSRLSQVMGIRLLSTHSEL